MTKVYLLAGIVAVLFFGYLIFAHYKAKRTPPVKSSAKIRQLNNRNFKNLTRRGIMLVDFWAGWCEPCKLMLPVYNDIAESEESGVSVGRVNVEQQRPLAKKYKIRTVPTLVILKNGFEVSRLTGVKSKRDVLKAVQKVSE